MPKRRRIRWKTKRRVRRRTAFVRRPRRIRYRQIAKRISRGIGLPS